MLPVVGTRNGLVGFKISWAQTVGGSARELVSMNPVCHRVLIDLKMRIFQGTPKVWQCKKSTWGSSYFDPDE